MVTWAGFEVLVLVAAGADGWRLQKARGWQLLGRKIQARRSKLRRADLAKHSGVTGTSGA